MEDLRLPVEVVHAPEAGVAHRVRLQVAPGTTLEQAARLSGLLADGDAPPPLGVFGRLRPAQTPVTAGDRIELYRSLLADPKSSRRARASRGGGGIRRLRGPGRPGSG